MRASHADVMRKEYAARDMLVAVNSVCAQQRSDIVLFALAGGDVDGVVEPGAELLPFGCSSGGIDFAVVVLFLRHVDHVPILVGHAVSADQQRTQVELDCQVFVCLVFGAEGTEVDLQSLPNFLI